MLALPQSQPTAIAVARSTTEVINLWLFGKSQNTQDAYRRDVNSFIAFVEGKEINRWTVNDIQGFSNALGEMGLAQSTVNRKILAVKSLLSYTQKLGLSQLNAGAAVTVTKTKNTVNERILTESQVQEMVYSTTHPVERAILKLLYATGYRVSELCGLKWSDVTERENGVVQLTIYGKGDKTRFILIKAALFAEVQMATGCAGDYLFSTKNGKPFDRARIHRIIKKAGERVGIAGVSAHWFRHSHASHSLDRGCAIHTVQASLGHSSIETTQRYLHARPDDGSGMHLAI